MLVPHTPKLPARFFALDYITLDVVSHIDNQPKLLGLMGDLAWPLGKKYDASAFPELQKKFLNALNPENIFATPGGSAANTLCTLRLLLPDSVECTLEGIVGQTPYRGVLMDAFKEVGATLVEPKITPQEDEPTPSHALAYLLVNDGGDCSVIRVEDGSARTALKVMHLNKEAMTAADYIFFSATLFYKFSPAVGTEMLGVAAKAGKPVVLALPTRVPLTSQLQTRVREIIQNQAVLTLGNALELRSAYGTDSDMTALRMLQADLQSAHYTAQAFITRGSKGAWVVNAKDIVPIDPVMVPKELLKSTAGAGDASYAGFLCEWLKGGTPEQCGEYAMRLGALNVQQIQTRLTAEHIKLL